MAASSPSSSPRLPSPPPIAEDQIGPLSPGISLFEDSKSRLSGGPNGVDVGAQRRIRPGTRAEDMAEGPPLVELRDIDSAFQLTEHLKALHYHHTHPPDSTAFRPITAEIAGQLCTPPPNTSREMWLYELGRFLIQKTNAVIVALFADSPPCSASTCPEMRASEWQYLCAVHDPPRSCSAIDYSCHTLDWAANTLTSSKMFPSRLGLGSGGAASGASGDRVLVQQMKEIKNIFRRVYRIFAHAWFQHREAFWRVEAKTGTFVLFKAVCDAYGIIEPENYTIPPEAEGLEPPEPETAKSERAPLSLLRRDMDVGMEEEKPVEDVGRANAVETQKRTRPASHEHSASVSSVSTVIQEEEEEEEGETEGAEGAEHQPPQLMAKPTLDRQATSLRDTAAEADRGEDEGESVEDETKRPASPDISQGISRSDTLRPAKEAEEEVAEDPHESVVQTTVVEVSEEDEHPFAEQTHKRNLEPSSTESEEKPAEG